MINRKYLSILAGILIIIGIIGSLLTNRISAQEPISEEKVFDSNQVSVIDIDTDNANVNLYPSSEKSIKVTFEGETSANIEKSFAADLKGSTLSITYDEMQRSWFNFQIHHIFKPLTLNVYLPEKQYESFIVSNNNGQVMAEMLNADDIELKSNNGTISLHEIHSTKIIAETNNGKVNLKDSSAENIYVHTDNGEITIDHVAGDLEGETHNGKINITTETLDRNMKLSTHNGKIIVTTINEPTNVQFSTSVHNGKVNILDKYDRNATIGDGENFIELTSHNGNITVKK